MTTRRPTHVSSTYASVARRSVAHLLRRPVPHRLAVSCPHSQTVAEKKNFQLPVDPHDAQAAGTVFCKGDIQSGKKRSEMRQHCESKSRVRGAARERR